MTQLSGKIFQMKNAAGTENRFPRTVIEAVYGLSSYLQQQFASLADIYMPIEGISEALTGQEFVYRISPNTIKAKSLTLDRILGRSLAWNQILDVTQLGSWNTKSYSVSGTTLTVVSNSQGNAYVGKSSLINTSHKYYLSLYYKAPSGLNNIVTFGGLVTPITADNTWHFYSTVENSNDTTFRLGFQAQPATEDLTGQMNYIQLIDLTLLGIDNLTTVATVEAKLAEMGLLGYHDYSAGKLISNDASALETTGFNKWDEEWENGFYNSTTGAKQYESYAPNHLRNKEPIPAFANTQYYIKLPSGLSAWAGCYAADGSYLGSVTITTGVFTTLAGTAFVNFYVANYGTTYNNDICINLSDASRNGQYEPYWKRTLPLNLKNIRVKSHNIWDEEWEVDAQNRVRSKNYVKVLGGSTYYFKMPNTGATIDCYDANYNVVSTIYGVLNNTFTVPNGAAYIKFICGAGYGTTYGNNICINVSSSFNGQYEPHGILTFNGVQSAGSVYDEIVGNKHIKRVGSVDMGTLSWDKGIYAFYPTVAIPNFKALGGITCSKYVVFTPAGSGGGEMSDKSICSQAAESNKYVYVVDSSYSTAAAFKTAMSGVMLNYELATPIEYELVEPLVPTVKAGTTEARISPNADGLSAPFRADMTYSAQENNDSASSQYAAVAGRLLNPQTIWGQTFDGSSPVTGALTGVTNINSKINFYATGIGVAGNATISGGLSVHGTTAFDDEVYMESHIIYLDSAEENGIWYDETNEVVKFGFSTYSLFAGGIKSNSFITAGQTASSSDARLKDNITAISQDKALSILSAISGKEWVWNDKMSAFAGQHGSGLVAQEVQEVMPWAVLDLNGQLSLNYNSFWGIAWPVMQFLVEKVKDLESRLTK